MPAKLSIEDAQLVAKKHGGLCLSPIYINARIPMKWQCSAGHMWKTRFTNIKSGVWCRECFGTAKLSIIDAHKIAKSKGGRCLSSLYVGVDNKLMWECSKKHVWESTLSSVKNLNTWCPMCAPNPRLSIKDASVFATKMNGKCLSYQYTPGKKLLWQCEKEHEWKASLYCIKRGQWCPMCSRSRTQRLIYDALVYEFPYYTIEYNYRGFDWLRGQEIDIFIKDIKVAIEYDGEQHFMPIKSWGGEKQLKYIQKLDAIKNDKILASNDVDIFIRFNYKEHISKNYILDKLRSAGVRDV